MTYVNLTIEFAKTFKELSNIVNFDNRCHPVEITLSTIIAQDPNNSFLIEEVYESMDCKIEAMQNEIAEMKKLKQRTVEIANLLEQ